MISSLNFTLKHFCLEVAALSLLNLVIGGRLGKLQGGCRGKSPWGSLLGKFAGKACWSKFADNHTCSRTLSPFSGVKVLEHVYFYFLRKVLMQAADVNG